MEEDNLRFEIELALPNMRSEFLDIMLDDFCIEYERNIYLEPIARILGDENFIFVVDYPLSPFEKHTDAFAWVTIIAGGKLDDLSIKYPGIDLKLASIKIVYDL